MREHPFTVGQFNRAHLPRSADGAYLVGVLGEIPDGQVALQELRRVLKPNGRFVISEIFFDPDFVSWSSLQDITRGAGFVFERKLGRSSSYSGSLPPSVEGTQW